jgi:hypothetical protein
MFFCSGIWKVGVGWTRVIRHEKSKFGDIDKTCARNKNSMFTQRLNQSLE